MNEPLRTSVSAAGAAPPLNPSRFAKLDLVTLRDYAKKWFPLDSAFAMCLNVALLQGAGKELATDLAKGLSQVPMAQAFYLYRTGGLLAQALTTAAGPIASLIRPQASLPGLVLDAIVAAEAHDQGLYKNLLQKIISARPDFMMTVTSQAFLNHAIESALGTGAAEALNAVPGMDGEFKGEISIAGLIAVRNEGARVISGVDRMLGYCDFVLILDHLSTDGAAEETQAKFGKDRVEILRLNGAAFNEQAAWDALFVRARERKATHFAVLDADEILGPGLANPKTIRAEARKLQPGESLAAPVADIYGAGFMDYAQFSKLNDLSRLLPLHRDLLYCDDGKALHRPMPLHNPRPPEGFPSRRRFTKGRENSILHFDRANPMNAFIKPDWYIAKELLVYKAPMPLVLARYLPHQVVNNVFWDKPPPADNLAKPPHEAYARLASWQLEEMKSLAPGIPSEARFLFNLNYWS